ncbi:S41 family peptidase [Oxyplasma meridianum]|uniref:Tricorn protease n=1 Tax=Oxyplasma meridianum TaxID=3073602 RepID=A0AAX4NEX4_9ARCH
MNSYLMWPEIKGENLFFVHNDQLWRHNLKSGESLAIIGNAGAISNPKTSPNGKKIAFRSMSSKDSCAEVYTVGINGDNLKRVTFIGSPATNVVGWNPKGNIIVSSDYNTPMGRWIELFEVPSDGGEPVNLGYGPANHVVYSGKTTLLGRNTNDVPFWKRYGGGTSGSLWIDPENTGNFKLLLKNYGRITCPMIHGDRVLFVSDKDGIANLYSIDFDGKNIKKISDSRDFYVRNTSIDGEKIAYQAGGKIFILDLSNGKSEKVSINVKSPGPEESKKFVNPEDYLTSAVINKDSTLTGIVSRGHGFVINPQGGPVYEIKKKPDQRIRNLEFVDDENLILTTSDGLDEFVVKYNVRSAETVETRFDWGIVHSISLSPDRTKLVLLNNRFEMHVYDLKDNKYVLIDSCEKGFIEDAVWSPDSRWIAYSFKHSSETSNIRIASSDGKTKFDVTSSGGIDYCPSFDPNGGYLYYISRRSLDPVYDKILFDLGYPTAAKVNVVSLRIGLNSPANMVPESYTGKVDEKTKFNIDADNIGNRIETMPMEMADYEKIFSDGSSVFYLEFPPEGAMKYYLYSTGKRSSGTLKAYDIKTGKTRVVASGVSDFSFSGDMKKILIDSGGKYRITLSSTISMGFPLSPGMPGTPEDINIDIQRIRFQVDLKSEWSEMFREAWKLMNENYWNPEKVKKEWKKVYDMYQPLLEGISTRSELSDLIKEANGELGTSHAYEMGGDITEMRIPRSGKLGIRVKSGENGFHLVKIFKADQSNPEERNPLLFFGLDLEGSTITGIDNEMISSREPLGKYLLGKGGYFVNMNFLVKGKSQIVTVKALEDDKRTLYRDWVEANRSYVHSKTDGKVGYVHIPDMGPMGFGEFHRLFIQEYRKNGLIVDVRWNGGGHVSQLILEKLRREILGYDFPRRGEPEHYPAYSVNGPIVALTNEMAGSDGDIFSHSFKLMKLGPLLGTRTWGGVVGINPKITLVDGTTVTQPQFAFWFKDVGWGVENYGTDPDIEIENSPTDYIKHRDMQLDRTIDEINRIIKEKGKIIPELPDRK